MTQEDTSTSARGNGWGALLLSLAAIVISVIALFQSCSSNSLSREANDLSAKNVQVAETQLAMASVPNLQATYYAGESLSLDMPADKAFIEDLGLSPTIIKSGYWRSTGISPSPDKARFLFILVSNFGPGTATRLSISGDWIPKDGSSPPVGLFELEGPTPLLPPGRFLGTACRHHRQLRSSSDPGEPVGNSFPVSPVASHVHGFHRDARHVGGKRTGPPSSYD